MYFRLLFSLITLFLLQLNTAKSDDITEFIKFRCSLISKANFKVEKEKIVCTSIVPKVYEKNQFERYWSDSKKIQDLIRQINSTEDEGLNPKDYHLKKIVELSNSKLSDVETANFDILLTDAFLLYSSHIYNGKTNKTEVSPDWEISNSKIDLISFFNSATSNNNIYNDLESLKPTNLEYLNLKEGLKLYNSILLKNPNGLKKIDKGESIKLGMTDNRILDIRNRLSISGELLNTINALSLTYDDDLRKSIVNFQIRHGLESDGIIGKETIEALNIPIEKKIEQIKVNLERMRWLPRNLGNYYVEVNIPNFKLKLVKNQVKRIEEKVIIGREARKTPVFTNKMSYLVFNPFWTVPPTIIKKDILPSVKKDPEYLIKKNIRVIDNLGNELNQSVINWDSSIVKTYTFRQDAGSTNALGIVKFMFPNRHFVYIHDTPDKHLFNTNKRTLSSGCIRVENALDMAKFILEEEKNRQKDKTEEIISSEKPTIVKLNNQIDVYILYFTSWAEGKEIHFREDIYKRDRPIRKALEHSPTKI